MRDLTDGLWWVGGSPCSGKTTVAAKLANDFNAHLYSCDDAFDRHAAAVPPGEGPTFAKVATLGVEQRLNQAISTQVDDVFALSAEQWPLIAADLRQLSGPVVVEGAALLPEVLSDLGVGAGQAVWMVPTEAFQCERYAQRHWAKDLVKEAADPAATFERWMQRDVRFALQIADRAQRCGYAVEVTSGVTSTARELRARSPSRHALDHLRGGRGRRQEMAPSRSPLRRPALMADDATEERCGSPYLF